MNMAIVFLMLTALTLSPLVSFAETPAVSQPASQPEPGVGQQMKDSWITSKTKMAFVTDKRVKARRIKVETQSGTVTLRGKVGSTEERTAAEQIAHDVSGVSTVRNTLEVIPEASRKSLDARDEEITRAVRDRLGADEQLK